MDAKGRSLSQVAHTTSQKLQAEKRRNAEAAKIDNLNNIVSVDKLKKISSISKAFERSWGSGKMYKDDTPADVDRLISSFEWSAGLMENVIKIGGFTSDLYQQAQKGLNTTTTLINAHKNYFTPLGLKNIILANDIFKTIVNSKNNIVFIKN